MTHARLVILVSMVCLLVGAASPAPARESAEAFLPFSGIAEVMVSPNGRWVAAVAYRGDEWAVLVQQVGKKKIVKLLESDWVSLLAWESSDALIVRAGSSSGMPIVVVTHLRDEGGTIEIDRRTITAPGALVDPLPLVDDEVLWEFEHDGWTSLHRISIRELVDFNTLQRKAPRAIDIADKLTTVYGSTVTEDWIIDRRGHPRAARRRTEDGFAVLMAARDGGPLHTVHQYKDSEPEREMVPVGLTADGSRVIVKAYRGGDTAGLFEFDQEAGALADTVFSHPDFDVEDIVTDPLTGDLIAAVYYNSGERRHHYFEEYRDRFLAKLPAKWRSDSVEIRSGTADRRVFAFLDSNDTNPGEYFIRDANGQVLPIGRAAENVDRAGLVPVQSFRVKSRDGTEVEAFLTLPRAGEAPAPLVVMPHGGPQDVADNRSYDGFLQYLASWGFAVLQINYRGSSGYGIEFERLGKKEWARGIEDDIDAAVEHAMALPEVDESRICIVGGSYGGFSALASVIRHRDRYRCAVSFNGVSDVPLLYDSSDMADSKRVMDFYQEFVGDLETERPKLIEVSPAYHVAALDVPLLIVFGSADRRVDPDHSHRMLLMLELYGMDHEFLELKGAGHSPRRAEAIIYLRAVRRFLSEHLRSDLEFRPDPGI